ncbi:MAG: repeat containing protein [Nevskia sp.]|nr:repeat containing protein [Nevskia sp.]
MSMQQNNNGLAQVRGLFLGGAALAALTLSACSGGDSSGGMSAAPAEVTASAAYVKANANTSGAKILRGKAKGGDQAVALSVVTLYAAGNSGAGSASAIGLGLSDQNGDVTAVYFCPAGNPQVYAVAQGGLVGNHYNTAIGLSAALGHCNSLPASAVIDEVTTVASVYALSQFLDASGQKPGASVTNAVGLNGAVAAFGNLADLSTGLAQTTLAAGATGTPPTATVNTLANTLAPCVTASGPTSSACAALFSAATPTGSSAPTSTLQAALNIARAPGANVAAVFGLAGSSGPFLPVLGAAPNDWTVAISFTGGALDQPKGLAVDATGTVWVANVVSDSSVNSGLGSVVSLSPAGVQSTPFTDNNAMHGPSAVAIDGSGNVWVANGGSTTASGLGSTGASLSGSPFSLTTAVRSPVGIAVDASGNVWAAARRNATVLSAAGAYAPTSYVLPAPVGGFPPAVGGLALDDAGNVWLSDSTNVAVLALSAANPAQQLAGSPFKGGGLALPKALALDAAGNVWVPNSATFGASNGVTELLNGSTGYSLVNFSGNGVYLPGGVAVDGAGNAWIANEDIAGVNGVAVLNASGAPLSGTPYVADGALLRQPANLAVDASGNVWVAGSFGNNVVEVVGAAAPVKTPLIGQPRLP